jgi:hypothetical protein
MRRSSAFASRHGQRARPAVGKGRSRGRRRRPEATALAVALPGRPERNRRNTSRVYDLGWEVIRTIFWLYCLYGFINRNFSTKILQIFTIAIFHIFTIVPVISRRSHDITSCARDIRDTTCMSDIDENILRIMFAGAPESWILASIAAVQTMQLALGTNHDFVLTKVQDLMKLKPSAAPLRADRVAAVPCMRHKANPSRNSLPRQDRILRPALSSIPMSLWNTTSTMVLAGLLLPLPGATKLHTLLPTSTY